MGSSGSTEKSGGAAGGESSASAKNVDQPKQQRSDSRRAASEPASAAPKPVAGEGASTPVQKRSLQASQSDPGPRRQAELGVGPAVSSPVGASPTTRQPHPPSQPRTGRPSSGRSFSSAAAAEPSRTVDDEAFGTTYSSPVGSPAGALTASPSDRRRQRSPSPACHKQPDSSVSSLRSDGWKPESAESTRSETRACDSDSDSEEPSRSVYSTRSMRIAAKRAHVAAVSGLGTSQQRQLAARRQRLLLASALM